MNGDATHQTCSQGSLPYIVTADLLHLLQGICTYVLRMCSLRQHQPAAIPAAAGCRPRLGSALTGSAACRWPASRISRASRASASSSPT